jgi:hypothetical protein
MDKLPVHGVCDNCQDLIYGKAVVCIHCKTTIYCNEACRRARWDEHQNRCRVDGKAHDVIKLLIKAINKDQKLLSSIAVKRLFNNIDRNKKLTVLSTIFDEIIGEFQDLKIEVMSLEDYKERTCMDHYIDVSDELYFIIISKKNDLMLHGIFSLDKV